MYWGGGMMSSKFIEKILIDLKGAKINKRFQLEILIKFEEKLQIVQVKK
jgi:hypothetical protein